MYPGLYILAMILVTGLSACGQKAPLYLPDRPAPPASTTNGEFDAQPASNAGTTRKP
ncbi:MAG: LPS translocon maturation chaperone LptM [Burkholderiaceae bacterium]|nr:hypothetical protein [Burkholderiaceae bacterium]MBU6290661.1 lipoprotein [Burkholderiales bacterium]NCV84845.1 hypothetical protein [Oxalobacteraceae bacterium]NCW84917.1 hypothetical protein [Oxalobacteraceae bacterium]NDG07216.1 hypothetical protein [Oxalobacteraceae bacterium]